MIWGRRHVMHTRISVYAVTSDFDADKRCMFLTIMRCVKIASNNKLFITNTYLLALFVQKNVDVS